MKVTASQIRQDLNNFGGFGQQGYGYNVKYLYTEIGKILGLNEKHKFVIIGAGNLGQALANYAAFENRGFVLKGLFDVNPRLAGLTIRGVEIRMMDELKDFVKENDIEIGVLTIPKTKAVEVANLLVDNGVKAIWNFAHTFDFQKGAGKNFPAPLPSGLLCLLSFMFFIVSGDIIR